MDDLIYSLVRGRSLSFSAEQTLFDTMRSQRAALDWDYANNFWFAYDTSRAYCVVLRLRELRKQGNHGTADLRRHQ